MKPPDQEDRAIRYVIVNTDKDETRYVANGGESSYTNKLQLARTFTSEAAAKRHACGNESVCNVLTRVLQPPDDSNR